MNLGKISESILHTSVLKYTKQNLNKNECGADVVSDCAFSACVDEEKMPSEQTHSVVCSLSLPVSEDILMKHVIWGGINQMIADGFFPTGILLAITLPQRTRQTKLTNMMKLASSVCKELNVPIFGGHTEVSDSVISAVVSATVLGSKSNINQNLSDTKDVHAKNKQKTNADEVIDLVVTKYIGLEAASLIATRFEEELLDRFPRAFIDEAKGYEKYLSLLPEAATAMKSGACMMQTVREGGIFAALWSMSQKTGAGLTVDLKKIPVKQAVIEICNYYDLNPYEILSTGCLLIAIKDGECFVEKLKEQGIHATVIGRLENGNDKIIINGEEKRFLDKPKPDQIRELLNQNEIIKRRQVVLE